MRLAEAQELRIGDRVLYDHERWGYTEAHIREISPSGKRVLLSYTAFGDAHSWYGINVLTERLAPLPKKRGWFS